MIGRLLPWCDADGKPAYLVSNDGGSPSYLSRLADNLEATQLGMGRSLLDYVTEMMTHHPSDAELRAAVRNLCHALTDALRVAESRGARLPVPEDDDLSREATAAVNREIMP